MNVPGKWLLYDHFWPFFCHMYVQTVILRCLMDLNLDWFKSYGLRCSLMPKTSISWKSIWIYLKSQIQFQNLKIWFKSEKSLSCLKIYFKQMDPRSGAMCMYSTLSHDKLEYTHMVLLLRVHVWNQFSSEIKKFQI